MPKLVRQVIINASKERVCQVDPIIRTAVRLK